MYIYMYIVYVHMFMNIQLFQFTLSDQSLKPTRQDRRGIWDLNERMKEMLAILIVFSASMSISHRQP